MKRRYIAMPLIALALVGGGALYATNNKAEAPMERTAMSFQAAQDTSTNVKSSPQPLAKGQYLSYSPGIIEATAGTKLLFFHAAWCRQCQQIEASINQQGLPDGVSVIKVDYDNSAELRKKYGITLQTTFVRIDNAGNELAKFVAYQEPTFDSVKREML